MSYGDFSMQIKERGAEAIERVASAKCTQFRFDGQRWSCPDKQKPAMTAELADGYEMLYCLRLYCHLID